MNRGISVKVLLSIEVFSSIFNITTINNINKIYNREDQNENNSLHRYILLSKQEKNSQLDTS